MNLGERITNLRKSRNLTAKQLSEILFVSDKTISSWETNRTEPNLSILDKLSEIFDCSLSYLINGHSDKFDIETEIKIKLSKSEYENLKDFMNNNARFIKETRQIDNYYQPAYREFINKDKLENNEKIKEWLRIGVRGNKNILNYKNWYDNYCDEFEVEIDNVKNLEKIFKVLNIEPLVIVDKVRNTYEFLDKYEVVLDYVNDLGYYMEIEVKKYEDKIDIEYDNLIKIIKDLNLNLENIDKRGYPYLLIKKIYK